MNSILNHLWQSTAFAVLIALAAIALRRNSPRLRYWLWLAASIKFLIPFSLLVSTGAQVTFPQQRFSPDVATVVQISTYFEPVRDLPARPANRAGFPWTLTLSVIWFTGASLLLLRWFLRWNKIRVVLRQATRMPSTNPVPILASPATIEPGVFGIFRPVLLLPEDIAEKLTPTQFEGILAHEFRHIRCFDNLTAALHMGVETLFWFHPLVWWIGGRLIDERERDCDEAVLRQGTLPADYARCIVHVCETYVKTELPCAPGISGSDLKKRVREIMMWRGSLPVTLQGKMLLVGMAIVSVSVPFFIGVLQAQTGQPAGMPSTFEVASVRVNKSGAIENDFKFLPGGRVSAKNTPLGMLISEIYYPASQFRIGPDVPSALLNERYDIEAVAGSDMIPPGASLKSSQVLRSMFERLLSDRFKLVVHREVKTLPVYALVVGKNGPKLERAKRERECHDVPYVLQDVAATSHCHLVVGFDSRGLYGEAVDMSDLARFLTRYLNHVVLDKTGVSGLHDFETAAFQPLLRQPPDEAQRPEGAPSDDSSRPTLNDVLEKLGLKLESQNAPIELVILDHIERPSEN